MLSSPVCISELSAPEALTSAEETVAVLLPVVGVTVAVFSDTCLVGAGVGAEVGEEQTFDAL